MANGLTTVRLPAATWLNVYRALRGLPLGAHQLDSVRFAAEHIMLNVVEQDHDPQQEE